MRLLRSHKTKSLACNDRINTMTNMRFLFCLLRKVSKGVFSPLRRMRSQRPYKAKHGPTMTSIAKSSLFNQRFLAYHFNARRGTIQLLKDNYTEKLFVTPLKMHLNVYHKASVNATSTVQCVFLRHGFHTTILKKMA